MKAAKYQLLLAYEAGQCPAEAPESKYPAFNNNISFTYRFKCLWHEFIVMITKPNNKVENGLKIETRRYRLTTSFVYAGSLKISDNKLWSLFVLFTTLA